MKGLLKSANIGKLKWRNNEMKIEFNTDSAAFDNDCGGSLEYETIRILRDIIDEIKSGRTYGSIMDINGNKVGTWEL